MTRKSAQIAGAMALMLMAFARPSYALFEDDDARKAILDLRQRISQLEQRVSQLESTSQGQLTLAQSLANKDKEIEKLRGELEVANNAIRKLQDDNRTLYGSLDQRIKALEPQPIELDGITYRVPSDQAKAYQTGLDNFKGGNFSEAAKQFSAFLDAYPKSDLVPQVRYFLGSCQFAQGDYKTALISQRDLAKDFPNSPRAPDALLSMASSQIELRSIPGAKKTLNELISKYPDSPAAASAKTRLAALK